MFPGRMVGERSSCGGTPRLNEKGNALKPVMIAGIVLVLLGAFALFRGLSFGSQETVLRVGDLEVSAEGRRQVPEWIGGVAILGGILMIVAGVQSGRHA